MEYYPLTTPQQNIWNLQKYYEGTAISNLCGAVFYREKRDSGKLRQAIAQFIRNQSGIRLRFREGEIPVQYVAEATDEPVPEYRFASREEVDGFAEKFAREPIGLTDGAMYRFAVIQTEEESGILVALSHLIADAWTFGLMAKQLDDAYRNPEGEGTHLSQMDYREFIAAEKRYVASERYRRDKVYWDETYAAHAGERMRAEESPVKFRIGSTDSIAAERITKELPLALEERMTEFCRKRGVTPAVFIETIIVIYLSKVNQDNHTVTVGVPVLNRCNAKEKRIAGMFVSTMPLTVSVKEEMSVVELAGQIARGHMELFRHQKFPYADILRALRENQKFSSNLYDVMVSYQNVRTDTTAETKWYSNGYSEIPLTVHIDNRDGRDSHTINVDYQAAVFGADEVRLLLERLEFILEQVTADTDRSIRDIKIVPERELKMVKEEFNDTYVDYPREKCVHELFAEQVARTPNRTALVFEKKKFTYLQLNEMSDSLAWFLRERGVKPNDVVPIIAKRSWHVIVAMLGILKAGGAYMPVSPDYPEERVRYMLAEAECRIVLLYGYDRTDMLQKQSVECVELEGFGFDKKTAAVSNVNQSGDLCYVIYTSGSTGRPKGVSVCHRNVINYCSNNSKYNNVSYNIARKRYDSIVSVTNIVFDIFVTETLMPLLNGIMVYFANEKETLYQSSFAELICKNKIDVMQTTPTRMRSYMLDKDNIKYMQNFKVIILGGEAFPPDLYRELRRYSAAQIFNIYGPAETTVWSANAEVTDIPITIGRPIANTQIYILDASLSPLPVGVAGELCIAGDGVGKGYLNRPELTAERFLPNPFATAENRHGKVLYRTGDLARWRADGEIEYLGRIDTQVKIRGLRIELGEIESVMAEIPGVQLAAVAEKRDKDGRQYLVGYYTAAEELDEKELRGHLAEKLPKYMVPNYFMHLSEMPMTASGKTDRKNLPEPDFASQTAEYVPPETETEWKLSEIWQRLLKVEKIGKTDDFFELGGDSLLAISMLSEIEKSFHAEISVREIMEHSGLAGLAECLDHVLVADNGIAVGLYRNRMHYNWMKTARTAAERDTLRHADKYILLPQQKAIYAACMKEPGTLLYNMPAKIVLPEIIDRDRLKWSIFRVVECHRILKTSIRVEGMEVCGIYDKDAELVFEEYKKGEEAAFVRSFDFGKAPLLRVGFTEDTLLLDIHHIIADGESMRIILRDIAAAYEGKELLRPAAEYEDYVAYFYSLNTGEHKAYFNGTLKYGREPVSLPQTGKPENGGKSEIYRIPAELFSKSKTYARKNGLTDTMVFFAAYGLLLSKYTGKKEILSSIILRNRIPAETENMVGMFVNTIPVVLDIGTDMPEYMRKVKGLLLDLFCYQELPFAQIMEAAGINDKSIINTAFVYQGDGEKALMLEGQRLMPQPIDTHTAKFDLTMELTPTEEGCMLRLEYSAGKYAKSLIDSLANSYLRILEQLNRKRTAEISVLSEQELHRVVEEFNDTYTDYPREKCVHELFAEQVARTPNRIALVFEEKNFTYLQLNEMSDSLAWFLRERGVKPNDVVPIIAKRSWHVIVAMLGILKAGGAYMPVSPDYPEERVRYMLAEAECRIVLLYGYDRTDMLQKQSVECVELEGFGFDKRTAAVSNVNQSGDLCYVIYTSGSTGRPKGVSVCHRNVINYCSNNSKYNNVSYNIARKRYDSIVSVTNIVFDIFVTETLMPLLNGIMVYFANEKETLYQSSFAELICKNKIDIMQTTPTRMRSYMLDKDNIKYLQNFKVIILGGEAFPPDLYRELRRYSAAQIFNIYGPAETTVWSANAEVTDIPIPIGRPIANTQIYILDASLSPLPVGVAGELCIAGDGVGKGYLNRPELTAERFLPNPFATAENRHGKVLYRTGDLARWRADGEIEYLGRIDTQVKIRGLRIELGEIESVMAEIPGVQLAAVAEKRDKDGRQYLVGYYTAAEELDEKELRGHLAEKLPKYMVPNYFMHLSEMPMTASGKTDRKNLPEPDFASQTAEYVPPETETEWKLSEIWQRLLKVEKIGKTDDFFELGGDSLTAISMINELVVEFGVEVSVKDLMEQPVLAELTRIIEQRVGEYGVSAGGIRPFYEDRYVLLPQQKAIYAACEKKPDTLLYNMPTKIALPAGIDRDRLKMAIQQVMECTKLLQTRIVAQADEICGICDADAKLFFESYSVDEACAFVRPFDLVCAPLFRVGFTDEALLFDIHHIIADGETVGLILQDIARAYEGAALQQQEVWYGDYAKTFQMRDFSEYKTYFRKMLKCDFTKTEFPQTKNRKLGGASKSYWIPQELFLQARAYAKQNRLTDTMVFFGAYGILLSGYTGRKEVLSSIILQNRIGVDRQSMAGMFVNTLPVFVTVEKTTKEYFNCVQKLVLNLFRYQELPFWEIVDAVGMADKTVINTSFIYQADGEKRLKLNGEELVPEALDTGTAKFDFLMELMPVEQGCKMRLEYDCEKYDDVLMDALADAYIRILGQLSKENIAEISVLSEQELHRVVEEFNDTYVDYPREKCVHELFAEQVARTPNRTALVFEEKKFTYLQLDEMSDSLAWFLRERGVKQGDRVAVLLKRDEKVILTQLAVLKLGAVFIPVDNRYPRDRIAYILSESKARVLVKNKSNSMHFSMECSIEEWEFQPGKSGGCVHVSIEETCYIIFTSGSTGRPKGCMLTNRGLVNFCRNNNILEKCNQLKVQICVSVNTISFDFFIAESLLPLLNGYTVVLANEAESVNQELFSELVTRNHVNIIQTTPTRYHLYFSNLGNLTFTKQFKVLVSGGEIFTKGLLETFENNTDAAVFNICGPSECSVWATGGELYLNGGKASPITIGRPIANTQIYILDASLSPLPVGVAGELCIAGDGVGKGYLNRPELTAERFLPNPFATAENRHGKVLYRTGDLARWRADGEIEYLGRIDTQVKIRGLRIELGEIESVMAEIPGVQLAAVAEKRDKDGRQYLVGYYTAAEELDEKELRGHLAEKLPKYMVPNYFMHLSEMPMTASGKTDRKNLPEPDFASQTAEYVPPETETEQELCRLVEKILHVERVGVTDDFFALGGDSLTAITYLAKAHDAGIDFALQNVFDYPTVRGLCAYMEKGSPREELHCEATDFEKYRSLFAENVMDDTFVPEKKTLGNVLLTGATGFLGAHVLEQLLREETGKIYCLVRDGTDTDGRGRLWDMLRYYFGNRYDGEWEVRILPVAGDMEREELADNMPKDVQTVIHTAASVKHYGSYAYFHRVNVEGTHHVIDYAKSVSARLIYISTISVSGNSLSDTFEVYRSEEEKHFDETALYIGQPLDNVYVRSKFEAECVVYDAALAGLDAKVIRVGNLTNRASDFKFQPNYVQNAFVTRVKAILEFGLFPDYLMPLYTEFSPIDCTAEGVVRIAQYADRQTVFHLNSNRPIYFDRFLAVVRGLGIPMEVVEGAAFYQALRKTLRDDVTEYIFEALENDLDGQGRLVYDSNIRIGNDFTVWFLKKTGFEWPETDMEYISGYLAYFRSLGYLEV